MMRLHRHKGFSLVELVVFIVVIGFAISSVFLAFQTALTQTPYGNSQTVATLLAQGRMDFILGQRRLIGFANFSDLCTGVSPPTICTLPAAITGYTITSSITTTTINSDSNYKIITVTVNGPHNSAATLNTLVAS